MQLGDLVSGVNMLPNDSLNQGIQNYFKQEASVAAQKGQLAQNKINEVDNLLNVNLSGLQQRDMDDAMAAKEKLIQNATQAAMNSKDLGEIPWNDMKKLMAQKAALEQFAQNSKESQQLYNTRLQQVLQIKDPYQKEQALKNLNVALNLPANERITYLNNTEIIPPVHTTYSEYGKSLNLNSRTYSPQNIRQVKDIVKEDFANKNPKLMPLYKQYKSANPNATDDDFIKYATTNTINHALGGPSYAQKQAIKNAATKAAQSTPAPTTLTIGKNGTVSFIGASEKPNKFYVKGFTAKETDKKTGKTTEVSYKGGNLARIYKKNGKFVADIVVPLTLSQSSTSQNLYQQAINSVNNLKNTITGANQSTKIVTIPVSQLRNMIENRNIHFKGKNAKEIMDAINGKGITQAGSSPNPLTYGVTPDPKI